MKTTEDNPYERHLTVEELKSYEWLIKQYKELETYKDDVLVLTKQLATDDYFRDRVYFKDNISEVMRKYFNDEAWGRFADMIFNMMFHPGYSADFLDSAINHTEWRKETKPLKRLATVMKGGWF